jgi:hypothetical protein
MAQLFDAEGELVLEAAWYGAGDLLAVEPDTLLPIWWPVIHEGRHWTSAQRLQAFEDAVRVTTDTMVDVHSEVMRIVKALRLLRATLPSDPTFARD